MRKHVPLTSGVDDPGSAPRSKRDGRKSATGEEGTALIFAIVLTVSVAALVMAHLGEVNSEKRKISSVMAGQRATERAMGSLERARNIVNAAPYLHGKNTAIWAAIHSDPPYVPGTDVRVERVGPSDCEWFLLRAQGHFQQFTKLAQVFVRERSPITGFNLFVEDHPVGVSGTPKGEIHTNKKLEFMFPYGTYTDGVSASEGYDFVADATPENTRIWGPSNPAATPMTNVLSSIQFADMRDQADTLKVTDDLLAEVSFQGKNTKVDLYTPESRTLVPRTGTRRVFDGWDTVTRERKVMDYVDVAYRIQVPVYAEITEHVTQQQPKYTWHSMTRARREPTYEDRIEHYYENEEVWGTKFVARTTYEADHVTDGAAAPSGSSALEMVQFMLAQVGTVDALVSAADPANTTPFQAETDLLNNVITELTRATPNYGAARSVLNGIASMAPTKPWFATLPAMLKPAVNAWYGQAAAASAAVQAEQAAPVAPAPSTELGDLSQVDLERLTEILSYGSRSGNQGVYELRAAHEYVEVPYVISNKLVRKTRLKRVKTGERLVTFVEKIRRFSHNETKHVLRSRRVYKGDTWVARTRRVAKGWKVITEDVQIPRYRTETYNYLEEVIVPRALARTENVSTSGMIYIEKEIEKLAGDVNGRLTLVSNGAMLLTGDVCYIDDDGRKRMLNGQDPAEPFLVNPEYTGNSVLLLISRGDITYSKDLPQNFELNGTLVSVQGKCAMEGIVVSSDGKEITVSDDAQSNPSTYVKQSMRRLGGILAAQRPVSAFVDKDNAVLAGFQKGSAIMDSQLLPHSGGTTIPPCTPMFDRPTWTLRSVGKKMDLMQ